MKYLKLYEDFIQKNDSLLIVEKGTELFHGTVEDYDIKNVRPGGYDDVFWTVESSAIAQTYIPDSSGGLYTDSRNISKPSKSDSIRAIQKKLGIDYDYSEIEFHGNEPYSYKIAPVFLEYAQEYFKIRDELNALEEDSKKLNSIPTPKEENERIRIREEKYALELKIKEKYKEYYSSNSDKKKYQYINDKLNELGYEPTQSYDNQGNFSWKLKIQGDELLPKNHKSLGRLLIITPNRDLRIYDATLSGTREADLTDEDYHKIDWFIRAENEGYDGIKITDHCQSVDQGNVGHNSIGLFAATLKDVTINSIPAVHHELEGYWGTDWHTPEYKNYKFKK